MNPVISGVSRQTFTQFLDDVAASSPLLKLDHDIAIHFLALVQ